MEQVKKMKSGDMVSFNFEGITPAYGVIVWIDKETVNLNYKNPITKEFETKPYHISQLIKIGSK